jgi:hypothetical protein
MYDFHLPLPEDLHEMLRDEVASSGQPATVVAREALQSWLLQQRRRRRHEEIADFAAAYAGTAFDLDEELEAASIEALETEDRS